MEKSYAAALLRFLPAGKQKAAGIGGGRKPKRLCMSPIFPTANPELWADTARLKRTTVLAKNFHQPIHQAVRQETCGYMSQSENGADYSNSDADFQHIFFLLICFVF